MIATMIFFFLWFYFTSIVRASTSFDAQFPDLRSNQKSYLLDTRSLNSIEFERKHHTGARTSQWLLLHSSLRRRGLFVAKGAHLGRASPSPWPIRTQASLSRKGATLLPIKVQGKPKAALSRGILMKGINPQGSSRFNSLRHEHKFYKANSNAFRSKDGSVSAKRKVNHRLRAQGPSPGKGEERRSEKQNGAENSNNGAESNGRSPPENGGGTGGGSRGPSPNGTGPNHDGEGQSNDGSKRRRRQPPPQPPPGGWEYKKGVSEQGEDPGWGEEPYTRVKDPKANH